jgi:uncharacterized membrane protein YkoI
MYDRVACRPVRYATAHHWGSGGDGASRSDHKALTAAQATACIQTAVAERTGMVTKVEVAEKRGQRLCEVSIVDDSGKKYTLEIDANTHQLVKIK